MMTDDLKAPERIWVSVGPRTICGSFDVEPFEDAREYVRADRIGILEAALSDMTRQRDAAMAGAVKVKPLEWEETWGGIYDTTPIWRAKNPFGLRIDFSFAGRFIAPGRQVLKHDEAPTDWVEAAKAAAQANYEARTQSIWQPDPDRMLALTAAAYDLGIDDAATRYSVGANPDSWDYFSEAKAAILDLKSFPKESLPANAVTALSRIEAQAEARGMRKAADADWWTGKDAADEAPEYLSAWQRGFVAALAAKKDAIMALADATEAAAKGGV